MKLQTTDLFNINYISTEKILINQGGTSCFEGTQLVVTKRGSIPIKDIIIGDFVLSYNEETKLNEWNLVKNLFEFNNTKKTIKVKLKNGKEIIVTDDHKFFYKGSWNTLKHLLSLKYGNMENNTQL